MEQPLTPPEKQDEPRETFPRGTGRRRVCLVCNDAPREDESLYCFDCHAEGRRREHAALMNRNTETNHVNSTPTNQH